MSSLTANCACPPVVHDHCTLRSSERVVPTLSAPLLTISTKMLTSASLISAPIYQKSRGCGLQNCHPFLGVATRCGLNMKKELLTYHFGCHSNLVTIAMRYMADAYHPKKASCQILPQYYSRQKSKKSNLHNFVVAMVTKLPQQQGIIVLRKVYAKCGLNMA